MQVLNSIKQARDYVANLKIEGKKIALVPTMGYFHDGHIKLMNSAAQKGYKVIVSIFVNPIQFGRNEDLNSYPRDLQRDLVLAENNNVAAVFIPAQIEVYPEGYKTFIEVAELSEIMCGKYRPGHFRGVATVVLKLFNIIEPDAAFFGQKDYQQLQVIKKMIADLNLKIIIETVETIRESDGLAMSSRNVYLDEKERKAAPVLYKTLSSIKEKVLAGEKDVQALKKFAEQIIKKEPLARLEYIEIRRARDLAEIKNIEEEAVAAIAVKVNKVRLIDNFILKNTDL